MTAYVAGYGLGAGGGGTLGCVQLAVRATTYQVKIHKVEIYNGQFGQLTFYRYAGATLSSGVSVTPAALREGGPASTATARAGTYNISSGAISAMAITGTSTWLHAEAVQSDDNYQFPFSTIIAPGSAFYMVGSTAGSTTPAGNQHCYSMAIYYEELRLAYSY